MHLLISTAATVLAITCAIASGRTTPLPPSEEKDDAEGQSNLILLEVPVPPGVKGAKLDLEADKFLVEGKKFDNVQELANALGEERKGRSSLGTTTEPFHLVVPVARNFSSFKELFDILREDRAQSKSSGPARNLTYVKGSESDDVMLFFTP